MVKENNIQFQDVGGVQGLLSASELLITVQNRRSQKKQ